MKPFLIIISMALTLPFSAVYAAANTGDKFGDWLFECQALAANKTSCLLSQTLIKKESNQRVLRLAISKSQQNSGFMLVSVMPLGIYLPAGVTVKTEKGIVIPMIMKACTKQGCIASTPLSKKHLRAIKAGKKLTVIFLANQATPITLPISLNGISAGLKELK